MRKLFEFCFAWAGFNLLGGIAIDFIVGFSVVWGGIAWMVTVLVGLVAARRLVYVYEASVRRFLAFVGTTYVLSTALLYVLRYAPRDVPGPVFVLAGTVFTLSCYVGGYYLTYTLDLPGQVARRWPT